MSEGRRILIVEHEGHALGETLRRCRPDWDVVSVPDFATGLTKLCNEPFDGIFADTRQAEDRAHAEKFLQADQILESLDDGVAILNAEAVITWANAPFARWCENAPVGQRFYDALGSPLVQGPDFAPFDTALNHKSACTRLQMRQNRYLDLRVSPICASAGAVVQLLCLCRDVTTEVHKQQKLDAIHQTGMDLAALAADDLAEMGVQERVELLKLRIRQLTHDLLQYDVIEIRLLDRKTGILEPLLVDGMTQAAASRVLYARTTGNGVTGFVAATGKSYLCPDTTTDPLYIEGAAGARSSLTVALIFQDEVIGTLNVESPQPKAFGKNDLQFAEIFSREVAQALHTLELLQAEKQGTASASIEAVNREVSLPVDEILAASVMLLDRYIGHEPQMAEKLKQIIKGARSIKQCIQKVGENLAPAKPGCEAPTPHEKLRGLRVLVADSDERVRRSAHSLLNRFGCIVETARDGQEALTMARLSSYDMILVDIRLPDLAGHEAYRGLQQAQPKAQVILMTAFGYDPSHTIVKCRQEGLRYVLYKPFRVDQLLDALTGQAPCLPSDPQARPEIVRA